MELIEICSIMILLYIAYTIKSWSTYNIKNCVSCSDQDINAKPLHDIVHSNTPNMKHFYWIGDFLVCSLLTYLFCMVYIHKIDIVNVIIMFLLLQVLKSITSMVTILPDPSGMCNSKHGGKDILKKLFGNCNDLMFSGHTGFAFLCLMILRPYLQPFSCFILYIFVCILCLVTITTCNHYTIDVIMSYFVAYFVYHNLSKDVFV